MRASHFTAWVKELLRTPRHIADLRDLALAEEAAAYRRDHPNPLVRYGRKCFSQSDEDGITLEILRRIGKLDHGTFAEFGVGDGMENNTLILAALNWRGFWVGGETLAVRLPARAEKLRHLRAWVTLDNVVELAQRGLRECGAEAAEVVSMDLDGNDIYLVERLLTEGVRPSLFIVEYNAKFPPPVRFRIAYDPQHRWQGDDYFGASLASFDDLFRVFGYRLVCCNGHSGANAFFVAERFADAFGDVPTDIERIYVEPRYHLPRRYGHRPSRRTVERIIRGA